MTSENQAVTASTDSDSHVILINPFIVPSGKLEAAIELWEQGRDFLKTQPGYISTALHQSVQDDAQYRLINVAKWKSVAAFRAASEKMRQAAALTPVAGVTSAPSLYKVIRS